MIIIRQANQSDLEAIRNTHLAAFPAEERELVAELAVRLLTDSSQPETFSLVAEHNNEIIGHVALSPVFADDKAIGYTLAPLAVAPSQQRQGVGVQLVNRGIEELQQAGVDLLFVYGDPKYYGRFGFTADGAENYLPEYPLQYPFGWQMRVLGKEASLNRRVTLTPVKALQKPVLW